jgi:hypothetical protein
MQHALWPRAMQGDIPAAREVRNIIWAQIKLFGLDRDDVEPQRPRTVVVGPADLVTGKVSLDQEAFA